jgi:hypothetical protein
VNNGELKYFLAGPSGDPALMASGIGPSDPLHISVGGRNLGQNDIQVNITFTLGQPDEWTPLNLLQNEVNIEPGSGAYYTATMNSTSSFGPDEFLLYIPDGEWELEVNFKGWGGSLSFRHDIKVGDE